MAKVPQEHQSYVLAHQDCNTQKCPQFKGIRKRKWGSWGSEIRMPKTRAKIWLGSYKTADQAARAYDAAVYCLRGPNAKFNFPNSIPSIPSAFSLTPHQIQLTAARYARDEFSSALPPPHNNNNSNKVKEREVVSLDSHSRYARNEFPSTLPSPHNNNNDNDKKAKEREDISESRSSSVSDSGESSEERAFWESLFDRSSECVSVDYFPSIDDTSELDFMPTLHEEEQDGYISVHLWNF